MASKAPSPAPTARSDEPAYKVVARTQEEEDAYDYSKYRTNVKLTSLIGSIAHIVKGSLGGGLLTGHVAYMKAGIGTAIPLNIIFGFYMGYCLHLLVKSSQVLYRRTRIPSMSYADIGEAAVCCCPSPKIRKYAKFFRHVIDILVCLDLFGACASYQIIIAKSLKQLVENTHETSIRGIEGHPDLRVYMICMIPLIILICLLRHLKWLAPFSLVANFVIVLCIVLAIHYAFEYNPDFENMRVYTRIHSQFEYIGMTVFSMSCSGVVTAIENNMRSPEKFPLALTIGMSIIVLCMFCVSFFGYAAFLEKSESPLTINFPMTLWPNILKGSIAAMIYVTHALNFFVPFNLCFHYIKKYHNEEKHVMWELIYRAIFVTGIGFIAIVFPNVDALMGFLGTFALSNMAFIWPNIICLLVVWERPGFGKYNWRFWRGMVLIGIGVFILVCGSLVNLVTLISVFFMHDPSKSRG